MSLKTKIMLLLFFLLFSSLVSAKNSQFYVNSQNATKVAHISYEFNTLPQVVVGNSKYVTYQNLSINNSVLTIQLKSSDYSEWVNIQFANIVNRFSNKSFSYIKIDTRIYLQEKDTYPLNNTYDDNSYFNFWAYSPDNIIVLKSVFKSSIFAVQTNGYPSLILSNKSSNTQTVKYTPALYWNNETFLFNNGYAQLYINGTSKLSYLLPYKKMIFDKIDYTTDEWAYIVYVRIDSLNVVGVQDFSNISKVI